MGNETGVRRNNVKKFMEENKTLVTYVRDDFGFRKGVIVFLDKDKFGWSMVHGTKDIEWRIMKPHQLPKVQYMKNLGYDDGFIYNSPPVQKCINMDNVIRYPLFNREEALFKAICRATSYETRVDQMPRDKNLQEAFLGARDRAFKYFKD